MSESQATQIATLTIERDGFRASARTLKADNKALTERNAELEATEKLVREYKAAIQTDGDRIRCAHEIQKTYVALFDHLDETAERGVNRYESAM
jgi:hypothetical protein